MIQFGPSGNSASFYACGYKHTEQAPKYLAERNLDCFEYSFGRGVNLSDEKCVKLSAAFSEAGISISVHAPYYINFANESDDSIANSIGYVLSSARAAKALNARRIVFHPAAQGKALRTVAFQRALDNFKRLRDAIYSQNMQQLIFCPETMGKLAQIGTVEEIAELCALDAIFTPCLDFGHINAREQGSLKNCNDYKYRLEYLIEKLGCERMHNVHIHFSKIQYTAKGEVRHLTFDDVTYGPEFEPLAEALHLLKLEPYVICESDGTQAEDAQTMKKIYFGK